LSQPPFLFQGCLNSREALLALANGGEPACERIKTLLVGHVAGLNYIAQKWSVGTGVEKGILLKRWAHWLFPSGNQPVGNAGAVVKAFATAGQKFINRAKNWRLHSSASKEFTKWKTAAAKRTRRASTRACTSSAKRKASRPVLCFLVASFEGSFVSKIAIFFVLLFFRADTAAVERTEMGVVAVGSINISIPGLISQQLFMHEGAIDNPTIESHLPNLA